MSTRDFATSFTIGGATAHAVLAFREEHRLGRPAEASVTVQLAHYVDPDDMLGAEAELSFTAGDGPKHDFSGIVEAVTIIGSTAVGEGSVHHVLFHVVSRMALLARSFGSQIFQEKDVKEIVTKVLEDN